MKESAFKVTRYIILLFILIIMSSVPASAASTRYKAYGNTIKQLEKSYGKGSLKKDSFGDYYLSGVCYMKLVDFDHDGYMELLVVHNDKKWKTNYTARIYSYAKRKTTCIYKGALYYDHDTIYSISKVIKLLYKGKKTYLGFNLNPFDQFNGEEKYVTVNKNRLKAGIIWKWKSNASGTAYYINGRATTEKNANKALRNWMKGTKYKTIVIYSPERSASYYKKILNNTAKVRKTIGLK